MLPVPVVTQLKICVTNTIALVRTEHLPSELPFTKIQVIHHLLSEGCNLKPQCVTPLHSGLHKQVNKQ